MDRRGMTALAAGHAPCPRCMAVYATEGLLGAHLMGEHHMSQQQAEREAHQAVTGIWRDEAGRCEVCRRPVGQHQPSCSAAKRAARLGYRPEGQVVTASVTPIRQPAVSFTVTPINVVRQEASMPTNKKVADPDNCQVCARMTRKAGIPTKCGRHGGEGTKAAKRSAPKAAKRAVKKKNGRPDLASKLTAAKVEVSTLREQLARAEVKVELLEELVEA
jgi:hypothetical protein